MSHIFVMPGDWLKSSFFPFVFRKIPTMYAKHSKLDLSRLKLTKSTWARATSVWTKNRLEVNRRARAGSIWCLVKKLLEQQINLRSNVRIVRGWLREARGSVGAKSLRCHTPWMNRVTDMNESQGASCSWVMCHIYEWIMSQIWMSHGVQAELGSMRDGPWYMYVVESVQSWREQGSLPDPRALSLLCLLVQLALAPAFMRVQVNVWVSVRERERVSVCVLQILKHYLYYVYLYH